jgi:osmotically-inducible protein OsmY
MKPIESPQRSQRLPADHAPLDAYIAGRLVTAYALNEQLAPYRLHVDVREGVVIISGAVDDRVQRDLAAGIAGEIDEVREVRSEIAVESPAPRRNGEDDGFAQRFNDATLTARVRSRLLWNGATHGASIEVSTHDGVVSLAGVVDSPETRDLAQKLAQEIGGVERVENHVRTRN